jgi:hypothetical protein
LLQPVKPSTCEDVKTKKQHTEEKHALIKPEMHIEDKPEKPTAHYVTTIQASCLGDELIDEEMKDIIPEIVQERQEIEAERAKPLSIELTKVPESAAQVYLLNER